MSKGGNKDGLYVDTGLLRDHVSKLHEEKKHVYRLYENVATMRRLSDPAVSYQYDSILRDIEQLLEYFSRMADSLSYADDEAVALSRVIGKIVESDTEHTRRLTSDTFML